LYVFGGHDGSTHLDSVKIYRPNTNTWTLKTLSTSVEVIRGAMVVDMPLHLRTDCTAQVMHGLIVGCCILYSY